MPARRNGLHEPLLRDDAYGNVGTQPHDALRIHARDVGNSWKRARSGIVGER